jgi:hypothetical protein
MRRSGIGSGGGYRMNKHTDYRAPKVEPRANAYNPGGVGQLGNKQGNHLTHGRGATPYTGDPLRGGRGYEPPSMISDPVKAVGVGGGRTIYKTGTQCQTISLHPDRIGLPVGNNRGV